MTDLMVRVSDLHVSRQSFAVSDVSFDIPRGSVVGLVGPNGAGKTTVIRTLLGLIARDAGDVEILGEHPGSTASLARTGVVLDRPTAAPDWRVDSLARRLGGFYPGWDSARLNSLLEQFGVPKNQKVGELSRGQGVKLSLAIALAQNPDLLILDEPSSGLDPASRREVVDVIREFMIDPQHAVLFSTHITTDLDDLADELIVLVGGRIAHRGALPDAKDDFAMARGSGVTPDAGLIGVQTSGAQWSGLIRIDDSASFGADVVIDAATIDDIIIHLAADNRKVTA